MQKLRIMVLVTAAMVGFSFAGTLGDFEKSSGNGNGGSSSYDDDDDCGLLCIIVNALLSVDDDEDSPNGHYSAPEPRSESVSISESTAEPAARPVSRSGWQAVLQSGYGWWGDGLHGRQFGASLSGNYFQVEMDGTWDTEELGGDSIDELSIRRVRGGLLLGGPNFWMTGLAGFSMMQGENIRGFFSTRLAFELRAKYGGLTGSWDMDRSSSGGFNDFYFGSFGKKGPVQLDLGYRIRITNNAEPTVIQGPQAGISFHFGRWRYN